jgi:hypothetical protein
LNGKEKGFNQLAFSAKLNPANLLNHLPSGTTGSVSSQRASKAIV